MRVFAHTFVSLSLLLGLFVVTANAATTDVPSKIELKFFDYPAVIVTNTAPGRWFVDFGQDAFGYVSVRVEDGIGGTNVAVRFGEMRKGWEVETKPSGLVRYATNGFVLENRALTYDVHPPHHGGAVNPPEKFGSVMPFRYVELRNFPGTLTTGDVVQHRLAADFDMDAARFECSSAELNSVWKLCRDSMRWLTFDGVYIDGDRERKPYEADAYIQQFSSYAVDNHVAMPRATFEYLVAHPTWPTEWSFHMVFIAWADYMQTGNTNLLAKYYPVLKEKCMLRRARTDGLIHAEMKNDVIDWPPTDRDGYDMSVLYKTVVNAFYYRSMVIMAQVAQITGHDADAAEFAKRQQRVYQRFNELFWRNETQCYVDGEGSAHSSAHANFFPLAFGLVPEGKRAAVIKFLHERTAAKSGMVPSVYGAQYLLEALFENGDADTALGLMTTNGPRGWINMLNEGSTLTTEAWNFPDKPNQDWNHAWGSAPGNLIPRYVLGVRPTKPGYEELVIQPQLGTSLKFANGIVPTPRGPVTVNVTNSASGVEMSLVVPKGSRATVLVKTTNKNVLLDGVATGSRSNQWVVIKNVGEGTHSVLQRERR
jgi:alpha-L-rhamnosidase